MDKSKVLELNVEHKIKFIDLQFTDLMGQVKAVTIPVNHLVHVIEDNIWFDGSSIEGFTRISESDMYLKPDLSTYAVLPWTKGTQFPTARIICDVFLPDGNPFPGAPRTVLKRQMELFKEKGYSMKVGVELEFFLFKNDNGDLKPLPYDHAGYFDQSTDSGIVIRQEMAEALQQMNMDVEALHHEVATGQHEIATKYNDALIVADNAMTFKFVVKAIAQKYGLKASFMPKPIAGINGSGMHTHQSLWKDDTNLFYDGNSDDHLSMIGKHWIAGLLHHARAMTAVLNPTVNSYKRLVIGYEAPVYLSWATKNRSALIRVPMFTLGREKSVRCELRSPDPSSNPYLALAVMAAAGLDGVEKQMKPPTPNNETNIFDISEEERRNQSIETLPASLREALNELETNEMLKETLGNDLWTRFKFAKMKEWEEYSMQVSQWEIDKYLNIL
mgnify:CR=1 FL=1|jgi:glutamine synthetase